MTPHASVTNTSAARATETRIPIPRYETEIVWLYELRE